ncbi:ATPase PAAT isoform X1 [Chiroxiphia lanceolata]|uniref:ATPase PAAT isoform X1 n=1 Tax=Chiroxiphia lanceolata TaxID=296741 RepID=UPI0013CEF2FA|nr:ATPase PAAT isoform X1 [Chiroxiphia lanceolata]
MSSGRAAPEESEESEEGARGPRCVSARCSWPCAPPGGLSRALCLRRGPADGEPGGEPVVVERRERGQEPCELRLECRPGAGMVSVGILSQARNMEVYVGEEYCGTGRGQSCGHRRDTGEPEEVTLYHKYHKFECPAPSCRIKLLSFGEKQRVLISKIIIEVKAVSAKLATDFPSLGSSIDLDRVQTIMESMGSKLSPGAQQLMDMVRCQQKNSLPLGDKLSWILGKNSSFGGDHAIDGLHSAAVQSSPSYSASEPLPVKNHLTSETVYKDLKISRDLNTEVPERGNTFDSGRLAAQQNAVDVRNDLKVVGSLHVQEQGSETPNAANPQVLLPFLQNLCSQVSHLRLKDGERQLRKTSVAKEEGIQCVGVEQQPICSYLEKIISKNMDLMEKKLMDYIDQQIQALQTHIDNKMVLLMDLVQNSKPNKISQAHYDSNEGFSNGER